MAVADEVSVIKSAPLGIVALAEDRQGGLWVGTRQGQIRRLFENRWLEPGSFPSTNSISSLLSAADGSMWVGTAGDGLFHFENGGFRHLGKHEGLRSDLIRTLYVDTEGTLWIGAGNSGLTCWQNSTIANFTHYQGLPDDAICPQSHLLRQSLRRRFWI